MHLEFAFSILAISIAFVSANVSLGLFEEALSVRGHHRGTFREFLETQSCACSLKSCDHLILGPSRTATCCGLESIPGC